MIQQLMNSIHDCRFIDVIYIYRSTGQSDLTAIQFIRRLCHFIQDASTIYTIYIFLQFHLLLNLNHIQIRNLR